jgi:DNA-binding LacI/PurR family transcriptional regulator
MAGRPTMRDIADQVGVSRVAVSYALNGRPGVSDEVRARVIAVADALGFTANRSARALRGADAGAIGLTLYRDTPAFSAEAFRRQLISGIQAELAARGYGLALQFVADLDDEMAVYRRWHGESRVDGVIVCDLRIDDPRPDALRALELPAVLVGGTGPMPGLANVWTDETAAAQKVVTYLAAHGHRRVTRISGPADLQHTADRSDALADAAAATGIDVRVEAADYTGEAAARLTRRILSSPDRPTAMLYDNDLMAVAGLGVAFEMGVPVPGELSIIAWEDSPLCAVVHPALTVLKRNVAEFGARATRLLFEQLDGRPARSVMNTNSTLLVRESTGPAR